MEDRNSFPGQEYSYGEDLEGTSVVPFSYTSFSIEIPNTYSHINYLNSYHPQHRPSEFEQTYPSVWDYDYNTHVFPCVLCCDPSGSCLAQYPSVCYPEILIPQSSPYQFPSFTATSPMWTPGGAVECQPPSQVKPTCSSAPPEKNTLEQHTDSMRNFSEKSKKPCHCTKSLCLKLYCDCFANGEICNNCSCVNCCNNMEHETIRNKAIKTCLGRNPDAFNSKMHSSVQGAKGSYTRGCNCKSSGCLKNYCECYKAKIMCSSLCKCVSCSNYSRSKVKESAVQKSSHPDDNNTHHTTKNRNSVTCITNAVVEATCRCLVAHAEEAEKGGFSEAQAERDTLKEFGHCLTQIIHFMSRHTHTQS